MAPPGILDTGASTVLGIQNNEKLITPDSAPNSETTELFSKICMYLYHYACSFCKYHNNDLSLHTTPTVMLLSIMACVYQLVFSAHHELIVTTKLVCMCVHVNVCPPSIEDIHNFPH